MAGHFFLLTVFLLTACGDATSDEMARRIGQRDGNVLLALPGPDSEIFVWGGSLATAAGERELRADGAIFNLSEDSWRSIAKAPLTPRRAVLSFTFEGEVYIMGGFGETDAAAYDPAEDSWRQLPSEVPVTSSGWDVASVWDDQLGQLFVWHLPTDRSWSFQPGSGAWVELPGPAMSATSLGVLRLTDFGLVAIANDLPLGIGGSPIEHFRVLAEVSGADAELPADGQGLRWRELPSVNFSSDLGPGDSSPQNSAWASGRLVVWARGGTNSPSFLYVAETDRWESFTAPPLSACELGVPPGTTDIIVLARNFCGEAALLNPSALTWDPITDFPSESDVTPVWTGTVFVGLDKSADSGPNARIWQWAPPG